ncbi:MAG TPA: hypothetical protein VGI67_02720 [Thermoleophilaceae bacterium]|jgi:hypothetical protein
MTDEERSQEGAEEPIEDLEAPAGSQGDVVGGAQCLQPTCAPDSNVAVECSQISKTCKATQWGCTGRTSVIVIHEQ